MIRSSRWSFYSLWASLLCTTTRNHVKVHLFHNKQWVRILRPNLDFMISMEKLFWRAKSLSNKRNHAQWKCHGKIHSHTKAAAIRRSLLDEHLMLHDHRGVATLRNANWPSWLSFCMHERAISAKSPCSNHSIKAFYRTIINSQSKTKDYHPSPLNTMLSWRDTSMKLSVGKLTQVLSQFTLMSCKCSKTFGRDWRFYLTWLTWIVS